MDKVDPSRIDLAREFKANPVGPHSPDLQKLLKLLRWESPTQRYVALRPELDGKWYLGKLNGPKGHPLDVYTSRPFDTHAEVTWAVFRKRWEAHTGVLLLLEGEDNDALDAGEAVSSSQFAKRGVLGYADEISVANGERIGFKVSASNAQTYSARIVRMRCGDHANIGFKCVPVAAEINHEYPGRLQAIHAGSFLDVPAGNVPTPRAFTLRAFIWPTTPNKGEQALLGCWDAASECGYLLGIDVNGQVCLRVGDGTGQQRLSTGAPLLERHWYEVAASFDPDTGEAWVAQRPMKRYALSSDHGAASGSFECCAGAGGAFRVAAWNDSAGGLDNFGRVLAGGHYNGKLESPSLCARALRADERSAFLDGQAAHSADANPIAHWDFSQQMSTTRAVDTTGHGHDGELVNMPTRAMKGVLWDGTEYNWTHCPEHYGAIHFHDDDLYDCGWDTDFTWQVPDDLASGLYCAHLSQPGAHAHADGHNEDWIPFVVRPPRGQARAKLALLLPTTSYWAYANRHTLVGYEGREHVTSSFTSGDSSTLFLHHHPELGLSTYDSHSDGSGVCYSSRLRPVLSLRPKEALWQLPADTHIIDWLDELGIEYDVITEDDLDVEGESLLAPYQCVMTGTHPEYPSKSILDAIGAYQDNGGRFIYLGGNGFYWRVSFNPQLPGMMEMRRGEDGIRAWLAEGGEYYHSLTGELGGMWRRMGQAPQSVAGTGMTAQGFDRSTYYQRTQASDDPRAAFIFDGVSRDERIGDFGIIGGGAAGSEIDRADPTLGTPPHALVVAVADTFSSAFHWMKEELTHTHAAITGDTCPYVHCDMVFYETLNGGAVFSTSSIAWAGALCHDGYTNNVSRITRNVVERFIDPTPFRRV